MMFRKLRRPPYAHPVLLLLSAAISNHHIRHPLAHSILAVTILFVVLVAITIFTLPEMQPIIRATTFNQLLTLCIVALITVSLLRPKERFGWVDHICLAIVAATYALLLSGVGTQIQQQWLSISKQLLSISMDNAAASVNDALICLLCIVALIELVRCKYPFTGTDRLQLFIVALIATPFQFSYGLQEIHHLPFFLIYANNITKTPSDLVTLNILLIGAPVIFSLLWLFIAPSSAYLSRLPLVPLALACAALQSFLGPTVQSSQLKPPLYPLANSLDSIMHLNQLITYGLILIIIVLFCRWLHPFRWFEQFSLFYVAIVGALLQNAAWNIDDPSTSSPVRSQSPQGTTMPQLYTLVINKLLAQAFTLIVLITLAIAIISIFLYLAYQFAWATRQMNRVRKRFTWVDKLSLRLNHILLLVTTITSISLLWLFGSSISLLKPTLFTIPFNQQTYNLTLNQLIILLLIIGSLVALVRLSRPFSSTDRWIILINAIDCALLLFSSYIQQTVMQQQSKIMRVKPWLADPHIALPSPGIALGLLFAVLVSFIWVKRRFPEPYRSLLKIGFGLALICAMLQWLAPFFLPTGLIIITLSILLTIQVEQVQ